MAIAMARRRRRDRRRKSEGRKVEKKGGASSWVRLGAESLTLLLEGLNLCIKGEKEVRWGREWKEQGRVYSMIRGTNRAGGFIRLGVSDVEGKRYCIFVPRGHRDKKGWTTMAEKLKQVLGLFGKDFATYKGKGVEETAMGGSFAAMVRKPPMGNLGLAKLNKRKALLEFEDLEEARRVVASGSCAWEGTQVRLEHWSPRSGCWAEGEERRDVWVLSPPMKNTRSMRDLNGPESSEMGRVSWTERVGNRREEESYVVPLWWEWWPVLRRKCRNEADRQSREVRGEKETRGAASDEGWGAGGRAQSWAKGNKEGGRAQSIAWVHGLKNKGVAVSEAGPDEGPSKAQEVTSLSLKGPAHSHFQKRNSLLRGRVRRQGSTRRGEADRDG
ncbi:hypothetical protein CK203_005423 [Vitis vinifera]|uniref:Uncharacterized protein n=1 Tax=Vitis vinifera TaxID=29760 RepID=A0A438K460_VITVI|nr:hypothetical protein CK203_005423 [Vitis vinifera]